MKPFLFPYTYISAPELATCGRFFKGLKVVQFSNKTMPTEMQRLFETELVEAVMPDPATSAAFETALMETENWAQTHRLGAVSYAKGYRDRTPFFNASSVSQIRQDIRRADQQAGSAGRDENEIMTAYILLYMAQAFDIQSQTVVQKLQQQATMEKALYAELKGDASLEHMDRGEDYSDPAQFMLLDRLKAWSRVWMAGSNSGDLYITTRQAVIFLLQEHLLEGEDFIPAATVAALDTGARTANEQVQDLWSYCHRLTTTDPADIRESGLLDIFTPPLAPSAGLQLYLLPGIKPQQLFGRFVGRADVIGTSTADNADAINTVIGLIEPQGTEDEGDVSI